MKVLFVCSAARMRSFTARQIAIAGGLDAECAGTHTGSRLPLNQHLVFQSDVIFCMEDGHKRAVKRLCEHSDGQAQAPAMHTLNIQDLYNPLDSYLVWLLIEGVSKTHPEIAAKMSDGAKHLGVNPLCDLSKMLTAGW